MSNRQPYSQQLKTSPQHTMRIPQYMVREFRRQWCGISARSVHFRSISCDFRRSLCASARSCAEIPQGPMRKPASIWNILSNKFIFSRMSYYVCFKYSETSGRSHTTETICLQRMHKVFLNSWKSEDSHENSFPGETICL